MSKREQKGKSMGPGKRRLWPKRQRHSKPSYVYELRTKLSLPKENIRNRKGKVVFN